MNAPDLCDTCQHTITQHRQNKQCSVWLPNKIQPCSCLKFTVGADVVSLEDRRAKFYRDLALELNPVIADGVGLQDMWQHHGGNWDGLLEFAEVARFLAALHEHVPGPQ